MGLKLAMPDFAITRTRPSALALTHARLKAWWNGEAPPILGADVADVSASNSSAVDVKPADTDWDSIYPRACHALWGNGRSYPSCAQLEAKLVIDAGGTKASRLALFGGGTGGMAQVVSDNTAGKIELFENNSVAQVLLEKTLKTSKHSKRFGFHKFNWQPGSLPKNKIDSALFMFQGGQDGRIESGAFCAERILRPGASAIWLDFFATRDDKALDPCRGHEARSFGSEDEATIAFSASGLTVTANDDWTDVYLDAFDVAWRDLAKNLGVRQAALVKDGGLHASMAALQNLICWKARAEALRNRLLHVRRFILTSA